MATPRVPFGNDLPGRVAATMLRVLAAEMSDPARLSRGQREVADRAVLDIEITPGTVRCSIQGSRAEPYEVAVFVTPGSGVPLRSQISASCECPDFGLNNAASPAPAPRACKHVVAALFTLATEVSIDPETLAVWRQHDPAAEVVGLPAAPPREHSTDRFAALLHWPPGTGPVQIPRLEPWVPPPHSTPMVEEVISSARASLELDWG